MCNLYSLKVTRSELRAYFQANDDFRREVELEELAKDYVSKATPGLIVRQVDGERLLSEPMHWGWRNPRGGDEIRNVRNHLGRFWRPELEKIAQRCLVPFTRFQEWTVAPDPETGKKRPHYFSIPSRPIGTFAGVWHDTPSGPVFAFLTCGYSGGDDPVVEAEAAKGHIVGAIHPKAIPVMLQDEDFDRWLTAPLDEAIGLACAYPSQLLAIDAA